MSAPFTLFVAADGTIVRQTGVLDEDQLREYRDRVAGMNLSYALIVGMVATVNPCGFILLPTYLLYFLGSVERRRRPPARTHQPGAAGRALRCRPGSCWSSSWSVRSPSSSPRGSPRTPSTPPRVIGVALIVLGIAMLFGYRLPINTPKLDAGGRDRTVRSMFVYGIAYAVASIGCTIALFSTILFGTAEPRGLPAGVANVVAYGVGMALVVTALTVTLALANVGLLKVLRSGMQYVEMVAGAFVLLSGTYLLWYFWKVDIQEEGDPITDAVQRYQTTIQNFLNDNWQVVAGASC